MLNLKPLALAAALTLVAGYTVAQVPYFFNYNPGPTKGTKWMAKAAAEGTEGAAAVVMNAPRPLWARVCYSIGPSDSDVTVYANNGKDAPQATSVAWGGCADVFGSNIWIGNPHQQVVGGHYGIAPATPQ